MLISIRETRISRVVFAIASPLMGGASRWDVLGDTHISKRMPEAFGPPPEVLTGVLSKEAASVAEVESDHLGGDPAARGVRPFLSRPVRLKAGGAPPIA